MPAAEKITKAQTVILNEERIRHIRLRSKSPSSKGVAIQQGPLITLKPGTNFIPVDLWTEAEKNDNVTILFETEIPPSPAPEASPERVGKMILVRGEVVDIGNPLAELTVEGAVEMVRETLDTGLLARWMKDEGRGDVRKAIEKQVAQLNPPPDQNPGTTRQNRPRNQA